MTNIQIDISENGVTTLATAGKYCDRNIDVKTDVHSIEDALVSGTYSGEYVNDRITAYGIAHDQLLSCTGVIIRNASFVDSIRYRANTANRSIQYFLAPSNDANASSNGLFYNLRGAVKIDAGTIATLYYDDFRHNEECKATIIRNADAVPAINSGTSIDQAFGYSPLLNNDKSLGCFVYVPRNMVSVYQTDENWSTFSNCYRAIEDYPEICDMDNENWSPTRVTGVEE